MHPISPGCIRKSPSIPLCKRGKQSECPEMLPVRHFNFVELMLVNYLDATGKPVFLTINFGKRKAKVKRILKDL